MGISTSVMSSKFQITVPAWVRKSLDLGAHDEIVWMEMKPGEISVVSKSKKSGLLNLCGVLKGNGFEERQIVDEFIEEKKQEIELENK